MAAINCTSTKWHNESHFSSILLTSIRQPCADVTRYFLSPLVVFLNSLVIVSVAVFRKFHTPHNLMVVSLALADILCGLWFAQMSALYNDRFPNFVNAVDKDTCLSYFASGYFSVTGSVCSLIIITADRCHAVTRPLQHKRVMTMTTARVLIAVTWLSIAAVSALPALGLNHYRPCECLLYYTLTEEYIYAGLLFNFGGGTFIPLLLNVKVYHKISKQRTTARRASLGNRFHERDRTILISNLLFLFFVVFWLPTLFIEILVMEYENDERYHIAHILDTVWVIVGSLVNPIMYGVVKKECRRAYRLLVTTAPWRWGELRQNPLGEDYLMSNEERQANTIRKQSYSHCSQYTMRRENSSVGHLQD